MPILIICNSLKAEALKKLLIGFPSIDIPNDSNLYFWQFNGNNFGTDHASNGRFKKENFVKMADNYSIDGGPLIIVHENMKDVVIISPISTRTFQKYGSRFVLPNFIWISTIFAHELTNLPLEIKVSFCQSHGNWVDSNHFFKKHNMGIKFFLSKP